MIGYLKGSVVDQGDGRLVVGVGAEGGLVGYTVLVPSTPRYTLLPSGSTVELHVHTHVREERLDLFGFMTKLERELFLILLAVTGIGPKVALSVISGAETDEVIDAIVVRNRDFLTALPGVGKKTADRIVLELADTLNKKIEQGVFGIGRAKPGSAAAAGAVAIPLGSGAALMRDAKDALLGLGFREQDVVLQLNRLLAEADDAGEPRPRPEDLVKSALRHLGV